MSYLEIFGLDVGITPTVNDLPVVDAPVGNSPAPVIPDNFDDFKADSVTYWYRLTSKYNFYSYIAKILQALIILIPFLELLIPLLLVIKLAYRRYLEKSNNKYNVDTKPLRAFKYLSKYTYQPVKKFIINYIDFLRQYQQYLYFWLAIWLYNFNGFTIALEALAYYFYFGVSFDFGSIYIQIYKLFVDLRPAFNFIPWPMWIALIIGLFVIWRRKFAMARLKRFENRNKGFINELPLVSMAVGSMGKKKTSLITDMCLSQEAMLKDKAYELLLQCDLKFPAFPWINFENEIKRCIEHGQIYNLASCLSWINKKRVRFETNPLSSKLFDYDYVKYGLSYDDKLSVCSLFDVLKDYVRLYYIYIFQSSLIVSNYSVRSDILLEDVGNFPRVNSDFFARDSRLMDSYSRHSHILDFDVLRLGKKLVEDNPRKDSFEFGVVVITEVGKERGNMVENLDIKKSDDEANAKNDGFNKWLKMVRHPATVCFHPFIKVFLDEQRPQSLGADARELCDIIHIDKAGDTRLTLPVFWFEEMICDYLYNRFVAFYEDYRFLRGDNTLLCYLFKGLASTLYRYKSRVYNKYGYSILSLFVESGTLDGEKVSKRYYLMHKKLYANRFSTDAFGDYFAEKALKAGVGMSDYAEYGAMRASFEELKLQNSHWINELDKADKPVIPEPTKEEIKAQKEAAEADLKARALMVAAGVLADKIANEDLIAAVAAAKEKYKLADDLIKYGLIDQEDEHV